MSEVARTIRVVYAGQRSLSGGKAGFWYANEDGTDFGGFGRKLAGTSRVGVVIELEVTTDDRYRLGTAKAVGTADLPAETLAAWQLADEVVTTEKAKAATLRRIEREAGKPLDDLIAPLQRALDGLPWSQRAAATALIISKLR